MTTPKYRLFENVHEELRLPSESGETYLTKENYLYYHYCCDSVNDVGFGCGYRTVQSMCSMLQKRTNNNIQVPSIQTIQETLVKIGDKEANFVGSRDWIGSLEASYIFDELCKTPSYIIHIPNSEQISSKKDKIIDYFVKHGGLIFLGGDSDAAAKLITGIHVTKSGAMHLQIVDPHYSKIPRSVNELIIHSYVKWYSERDFVDTSFYNLCMLKLI